MRRRALRAAMQVQVAYYEIALTNGASFRITGDLKRVYEIDPVGRMNPIDGGLPVVRGPISLDSFISQLEAEKERRESHEH
jgi:hypothetical protein